MHNALVTVDLNRFCRAKAVRRASRFGDARNKPAAGRCEIYQTSLDDFHSFGNHPTEVAEAIGVRKNFPNHAIVEAAKTYRKVVWLEKCGSNPYSSVL